MFAIAADVENAGPRSNHGATKQKGLSGLGGGGGGGGAKGGKRGAARKPRRVLGQIDPNARGSKAGGGGGGPTKPGARAAKAAGAKAAGAKVAAPAAPAAAPAPVEWANDHVEESYPPEPVDYVADLLGGPHDADLGPLHAAALSMAVPDSMPAMEVESLFASEALDDDLGLCYAPDTLDCSALGADMSFDGAEDLADGLDFDDL